MKHLGDITQIHGDEIPAVDVITGGSPCQGLSVAGKRLGLADERSGLFMEQMRIVKEMRERGKRLGRTGESIRPRYLVWENVDGARSSPGGDRKGEDFAAVIEEIIKVAEPDAAACVRVPDKGWPTAGCYYSSRGDWSIAWRLTDAQYWGVPQRRRRIALLCDFAGLTAPWILFDAQLQREAEDGESDKAVGDSGGERSAEVSSVGESLPRDLGESESEGESSASGITGSAGEPSGFGETGRGYWQPGIQTIRAEGENRPSRPSNVVAVDAYNHTTTGGVAVTLTAASGSSPTHSGPMALELKNDGGNA